VQAIKEQSTPKHHFHCPQSLEEGIFWRGENERKSPCIQGGALVGSVFRMAKDENNGAGNHHFDPAHIFQ
jgi:hypothetical protein